MYIKIISMLLVFMMLCLISPFSFASGDDPTENPDKAKAIDHLNKLSEGNLKFSDIDGQIFLSGRLSSRKTPGEKAAAQFLEDNKSVIGIDSVTDELMQMKVKKDDLGGMFVKYTQVINGIKVEGSTLNVYFNKNGTITCVNGRLVKNKEISNARKGEISYKEAIEIAKNQFDYHDIESEPNVEKVIVSKGDANLAVYKVNIIFASPSIENYDVYIDLYSGDVIRIESNIRDSGPAIGSGIDLLGDITVLDLFYNGTNYQMANQVNVATDGIFTFTFKNGMSESSIVESTTNTFSDYRFRSPVSAHNYTNIVVNFYKTLFNRNSIDDNRKSVASFTNYGTNYNNAMWNGVGVYYGDGDGIQSNSWCGDIDIVAHELTHAVTDYSADLYYHNQSGAVNESISDIFGVLIETYFKYDVNLGGDWIYNPADWVVGDEMWTPQIQGDAMRSLANPGLYNQPDHMSGYSCLPDTPECDNGGVHYNSGILNKAANIVAQSIGMEKTARVYYRALVNYLGMYSDFTDTYNCLVQSAIDLYGEGSAETNAISSAYAIVGITYPSGSDSFEPNDTMQTAYAINSGSEYKSLISSTADTDYYKFVINKNETYRLELTNLPCDYDVKIYNSIGTEMVSLENKGTISEVCEDYFVESGTYYVKVFSNSGFSLSSTYSLRLTILGHIAVTGLTLDDHSLYLLRGAKAYINATILPQNATLKGTIWKSQDPTVAAFSNAGEINAIGVGSTEIIVTAQDGGLYDKCLVHVTDDPSTYSVYFDTQGGNQLSSVKVLCNATLDEPEKPIRDNYIFKYWSKDLDDQIPWYFDENTVSSDMTLYAIWANSTCSVTFEFCNGNVTQPVTKLYRYNSLIEYIKPPTRQYYTFVGWYKDPTYADAWDFSKDLITCNITLFAKWITDTYTVTFNSQGGNLVASQTVISHDKVTPPLNPTREHYTFEGWYKEAGCTNRWNFTSDVVTGNITLYAKWIVETHAVVFNSQCDVIVASQTVYYNNKAVKPADLIRTGYTFGGWYTEARCINAWNFNTLITSDITLYAKWTINQCIVHFYSQGESVAPNIKTNYNTLLTAPPDPTRSGYVFCGWYKEPACLNIWNFTADRDTADITLHAKWVSTVPTTVRAKAASYTSIKLSWDPVPLADGYELYRSTSVSGTYVLLKAVTATSYINTGLVTGKTYFYKVRSYDTVGGAVTYSRYSTIVSAAPAPLAPVLKATPSSYNTIKLAWNAVAGATKYELYRSTAQNGTYKLLKSMTTRSYSDTKISTGATYWYKVRAYRLVSGKKVYGVYSTAVFTRTILGVPSGIKAVRASSSSVKITWRKVAGSTKYEIWRCTSSANGSYTLVGSTASTSFTNRTLSTGKTYWYKVRAYRLVGGKKVYGGFTVAAKAKP